jgi:pimeloyl-ACP methyl ester carboxylesterase
MGLRKAVRPAPMNLRPLRSQLEALPCEPVTRSHPRNWLFRAKRSIDFIGHARPAQAAFFRRINPYPAPFEHCKFETEDGVTIACWYGPPGGEAAQQQRQAAKKAGHDEPNVEAPPFGLVIVPGMFSTKDDTIHKRRAIWMWRHWRIPIVIIDTRAFGESNGIATGGWKESFDVTGAAAFLKNRCHPARIGVLAESLGGASALNAVAYDEETEARLINGGLLCFSAFVDMKDAVNYISTEPPLADPFHVQWDAFRRLLKYKSHGGYERFDEYLDDAARVNGLEGYAELCELANPKWKTSLIKAPTMLVHAHNDPVVPIRHARRMERYARDDNHIQVMTVPFGGHTGFEGMEPWWFWEVLRRFFNEVNGLELPNPIDPKHPDQVKAIDKNIT